MILDRIWNATPALRHEVEMWEEYAGDAFPTGRAGMYSEAARRLPVAPLKARERQCFQQILAERCGLAFTGSRRSALTLGVRRAFAASPYASLEAYAHHLRRPEGAVELERLINAVTSGSGHFFHDPVYVRALRDHVLPSLIESRRRQRTLHIWNVRWHGGEEPYTIALLLRDLLPDARAWRISVLGFDLNTVALHRTRRAVYEVWAFHHPWAQTWLLRYFRPQDEGYTPLSEIRKQVRSAPMNPAEGFPSPHVTTPPDLILSYGAAWHLEQRTFQRVWQDFRKALRPGGWLILGTVPGVERHSYTEVLGYRRPRAGGEVLVQAKFSVQPAGNGKECGGLRIGEHPLAYARWLLKHGHQEQVRNLLLASTLALPGDFHTYAMLGQVYAYLGQWQDAEDWCRLALAAQDGDDPATRARVMYTLALVRLHRRHTTEAIRRLRGVLKFKPDHLASHWILSELYRLLGRTRSAEEERRIVRQLLAEYADGDPVPELDGVTAGRLREVTAYHDDVSPTRIPNVVREGVATRRRDVGVS